MGSRGRAQNKPCPGSSSLFLTSVYCAITAIGSAEEACGWNDAMELHSLLQVHMLQPF